MLALTSAAAVAAALVPSTAASAQASGKSETAPSKNKPIQEVIIVGDRRSAVNDIAPLAVLGRDALDATGATSMSELLRAIQPLTQSSDGGQPIFLLNGQRTSGYQEIGSLPPEAIESVEVLPEAAALKYGYPPTRRVVNFITKRNFRQIEIAGSVGSTTNPGSGVANANFNLTRLHNDSRLTVALERRHTSDILQSERSIAPDPDILFDSIGNVTGLGHGEIDPALSDAAGHVVTVAPVPEAEADRSTLASYAAAANQPRLFDLGPYVTLSPHNEAWKGEAVLADKVGKTLAGSISLTGERSTDWTLSGPARAVLAVPGSNPFSPFSNTVLLNRFLTEAEPLRARQTTTTLHAGGTLRGAVGGTLWDLTAAIDQKLVSGFSEKAIDLSAANAAIAAGANPFVPLDADLLSGRLVDRAHLLTRTMNSKLVASNSPVTLPAGEVTLTATLEIERLTASSVTHGADPFHLKLGRTRTEGGIAVDLPLTSRADNVLAAVGDLSINGSINVRHVTGAGSLRDSTLGLSWEPIKGVQLLVQDKHSGTAPDMEKLASPIVHIPNYSIFDFATGHSEIVDLTTGGNPELLPERKHVRSIGVNLSPFGKKFRLSATFEETDIRNQTGDIFALTPELESIFPDRFVRDSSGRLISVAFQPTNFYRERKRDLNFTLNANGSVGKKKESRDGSGKEDSRPYYYAGAGPIVHLSDRLELRPGTPILDLLAGDTFKGWGMPRVTSYFFSGIGYLGNSVSIGGWYQSSGRVRGDRPESDLYFSGIFKLNLTGTLSVHHFFPKQAWTHHLQLKLEVENALDSHQHVHDANGNLPNRFQPDFLDPMGRTVKLTVRKLF